MRALGIDVGVRKGFDVVLLDGARTPLAAEGGVSLDDLGGLIDGAEPDAVAIDGPPGWAANGRSRKTEREIRVFGIQSFGTPTEDRSRGPFYEWVRRAIRAFAVAAEHGFPRYGGGRARGTALEVFPHATAVVLAGCLPPRGSAKRAWRSGILAAQGVPVGDLRTVDLIDAALAALTGLRALEGKSTALGDPTEGVIVLPTRALPPHPYRRCKTVPETEVQPRLPKMKPCRCEEPGCTALTAREFAPGHDAKRKARLWTLARTGHEAAEELRSRGWELPPEMR